MNKESKKNNKEIALILSESKEFNIPYFRKFEIKDYIKKIVVRYGNILRELKDA